PGAMTAGAGQILLKASGLIAENAVLVGSGPLLYLLADQMIQAGMPPKALVETQRLSDLSAASKHLFKALLKPASWQQLAYGRKLVRNIRKNAIPRYRGSDDIKILGEDCVEAISFFANGKKEVIACDTVLMHAGVMPNTALTMSLQLSHYWNDDQACFQAVVDETGMTSASDIYLAGDGASIHGAEAAFMKGVVAAQGILKTIDSSLLDVSGFQKNLSRLQSLIALRPFLDRAFPPSTSFRSPADETVICRCENVTAGQIRDFAKKGCLGPNQAKAFGRSGMGPCQGRYCGVTVTEILAKANDQSQEETGAYRIRSPLKPVTLGELASLAPNDDYEDPSAKLRKLTK
ncbi:MAG: NAD(P)/FAD-dependent oxidoreductase, partial [Alphaproteobacteria bacterium]|nr:NAD(P)/FAD-dependent oxidoreductase [Alphaproteobacteria bacterium]